MPPTKETVPSKAAIEHLHDEIGDETKEWLRAMARSEGKYPPQSIKNDAAMVGDNSGENKNVECKLGQQRENAAQGEEAVQGKEYSDSKLDEGSEIEKGQL
jgi:hypothetical protein